MMKTSMNTSNSESNALVGDRVKSKSSFRKSLKSIASSVKHLFHSSSTDSESDSSAEVTLNPQHFNHSKKPESCNSISRSFSSDSDDSTDKTLTATREEANYSQELSQYGLTEIGEFAIAGSQLVDVEWEEIYWTRTSRTNCILALRFVYVPSISRLSVQRKGRPASGRIVSSSRHSKSIRSSGGDHASVVQPSPKYFRVFIGMKDSVYLLAKSLVQQCIGIELAPGVPISKRLDRFMQILSLYLAHEKAKVISLRRQQQESVASPGLPVVDRVLMRPATDLSPSIASVQERFIAGVVSRQATYISDSKTKTEIFASPKSSVQQSVLIAEISSPEGLVCIHVGAVDDCVALAQKYVAKRGIDCNQELVVASLAQLLEDKRIIALAEQGRRSFVQLEKDKDMELEKEQALLDLEAKNLLTESESESASAVQSPLGHYMSVITDFFANPFGLKPEPKKDEAPTAGYVVNKLFQAS